MSIRPIIALVALCGLGSSAQADGLAASSLPTLALNPQEPPSIWSGLYVGSEVFAIARKGSKGLVGGAFDAGYNHEFANKVVIGMDVSTGFTPVSFQHAPFKGYDYAAANVKIGYDMGRLMPYLTTGVVLAKPDFRPGADYMNSASSFNDLFNSTSDMRAAGTVGAGFDYAVTNNLHVGLGVSVGNGAFVAP